MVLEVIKKKDGGFFDPHVSKEIRKYLRWKSLTAELKMLKRDIYWLKVNMSLHISELEQKVSIISDTFSSDLLKDQASTLAVFDGFKSRVKKSISVIDFDLTNTTDYLQRGKLLVWRERALILQNWVVESGSHLCRLYIVFLQNKFYL